ncbi:YheC/YheD family protein [Neobacillus niacini]|uniref:YheC/YheD family endospore coat-associated protein n=1 Tax=Neobacillus niacini TaxID=86668 RepID=UPI00204138A4|nr:YheC/YheD family protein [Neobacillus niacini]MCM3690304.1 YheC/YheD family protein [Neobacillus niacini]
MVIINSWSKSMQPVIGILTAKKKNGTIGGNSSLFIELQKKLISLNGISFIFTLDGVHDESIDGFTFNPEKNEWERINFPYPDLVYNRIPFRKSEEEIKNSGFFSHLKDKNIPFFNPAFIDKYELYQLFKDHPILHSYLPATIPAFEKQKLWTFLLQFQTIYLKPAQSARGNGIFRLELDTQKRLILKGISRSNEYITFDHFWNEWENILKEKNYLAQEEILSKKYDGKRFDLRILAHAENDNYIVTGVGIRQSQKQEITTHIPSGGKLLPYNLFQTKEQDLLIENVVKQIGIALSQKFGFFGEFSIDFGISETGHYYIYEVNSKPMSFDEKEIEAKKIDHLCQLFLQLTDPNN